MHHMRARGSDGFLAIERLERIQEIVDGPAALVVRRELPSAVPGRPHHGKQFGGRDKELAPVVRIGLAIELLAEWTVRISLIGRADGHAAIERQLEASEFQPGIARVGGVWRGFDLLLECSRGL